MTKTMLFQRHKLTYWNNSPDELDIVYFHLYQNAFQEDSYYEHLKKVNNRVDEKFKGVGRGTEILSIKSGGFDLKTELDNTILKVYLNEPLKTGEKIVFNMVAFKIVVTDGRFSLFTE